MIVEYYYSACVGIKTQNAKILCDPWFTQGAFDGSWYHYPPPPKDPVETVGLYNYIYISHLHGDHYDPVFLKRYLQRYPSALVLIADFKEPNYLSKMMAAEGIKHQVCDTFTIGNTKFKIFPNESHGNDVDSALAVKFKDSFEKCSIVNMNDNRYNQRQVDEMREFIGGDATVGLFSYALGSGHPQTFYDSGSRKLEQKKSDKIQLGIDRYLQFKEAFNPEHTIPFAGKYVLGGKLAELNEGRAVIDAVDMLEYDDNAIILEDHGHVLNFSGNGWIRGDARLKPYDKEHVDHHIESISRNKMDYEKYFGSFPVDKMPLERLLAKAYKNAIAKSQYEGNCYLYIKLRDKWCMMNVNKNLPEFFFTEKVHNSHLRWEVEIDLRYLFGLLTGVFHWDNASVGSHYQTRRFPDEYSEEVQHFLYFLHV